MNITPWSHAAAIACAALSFIACGGKVILANDDAGVSSGGPYDTCSAPTDCAWGEIDHEILSSSDCVCLFGCPFIPLSKATVDRRKTQYAASCTPGEDGQGNPCGIDDCASPPQIDCQAGKCVAAQ